MKTKPIRRHRRKKHRSTNSKSIFDDVADLQIARKLWAENKRIESAKLFLKIVDDHPANIPSLVDASRAVGELFNYQKARELLTKVTAVGARSPSAHYLAGQTNRMLRQYQAAEDCLRNAIELDPDHVDARLELAILLERSGRLESASEHLERRLRKIPDDHESHFLLARILRRLGNVDSAQVILTKLTKGKTHPLTKVRSYSELCSLLDHQQEYESAWRAMLAGKEVMKKIATSDQLARRKRLTNYQQLTELLTPDHCLRWQERLQPLPKQRTAILTGLPRSGTTLLAKLMHCPPNTIAVDEHPGFGRFCLPLLLGSVSPEKLTLNYLDQQPGAKISGIHNLYTDMMQSSLEQPKSGELLIDKNPSLLPILIPYLSIFSRSPVLFSMRDPRDILISCLFTYMPVNDFAVDMMTVGDAVNRIVMEFQIWSNVKRSRSADLWCETRYEDLVADSTSETCRAAEFLKLNDSWKVANKSDSDYLVHSPSYAQVKQQLYQTSIQRWNNYTRFTGVQLAPLHELANELGY